MVKNWFFKNKLYSLVTFPKVILSFLLFFVSFQVFAAPVYVYKMANGTIHFSTRKPTGIKAEVFTAKGAFSKTATVGFSSYSAGSYVYRNYSRNLSTSSKHKIFKNQIKMASSRYGVGSDLISAVIHAESAFNPSAVSRKGARGLMQIMPFNAKRLGASNLFSPVQNINAGTKFLSRLMAKYRGNLKLALAAYNAGEGAVKKYRGIPPYKETQSYVTKVLALKDKYRRVMYG